MGQASRILGVTASDLQVLWLHLEQAKREKNRPHRKEYSEEVSSEGRGR
jgi:hypothetical protein